MAAIPVRKAPEPAPVPCCYYLRDIHAICGGAAYARLDGSAFCEAHFMILLKSDLHEQVQKWNKSGWPRDREAAP